MKTIDCRDMPVPKPVVLTKSTLEELPENSAVTIIVNCDMSEDNILAFAQNKGYFVKRELKNAGVFITISKSNTCDIVKYHNEKKQMESRAIIITSDCIGRGLYGDALMQEFLDSILVQKNPSFKNHIYKQRSQIDLCSFTKCNNNNSKKVRR